MLIGFLLPLIVEKIRPSAPTANGTGIMAAIVLGAVGFLLFIPLTGPLFLIGSLTKKLSGLSSPDASKTDKSHS